MMLGFSLGLNRPGQGGGAPAWYDPNATEGQNANREALFSQITSAPTIGTGSATITVGAANAAATLSGTQYATDHAALSYYGADVLRPFWTVFRNASYNDGSRFAAGGHRIRTRMLNGRYLEINGKGQGVGSKFQIWADNQIVGYSVDIPSDGNGYWHKVDFGSVIASREIVIVFVGGGEYGGFKTDTGSTLAATQVATGLRSVIIGDSFTEGTGATYGVASSFAQTFQNLTGFQWMSHTGQGGTGWVKARPGGGNPALPDFRTAQDVIAFAPDVVFFPAGLNDEDPVSTGTNLQTVIEAELDDLRTALPNALFYLPAPWNPSAPTLNGNRLTVRNYIRDACDGRAGVDFLDPTAEVYTVVGGGDPTHPNQAGHDTLGLWLANAVKANLGIS